MQPKLNEKGEILDSESFCLDGIWLKWGEMTIAQREKKINSKIAIAESCKDEAGEHFWNWQKTLLKRA